MIGILEMDLILRITLFKSPESNKLPPKRNASTPAFSALLINEDKLSSFILSGSIRIKYAAPLSSMAFKICLYILIRLYNYIKLKDNKDFYNTH